jgi:protease-4
MGNVAASGGYWVSTPGDFVYAEPGTITGSIGVFGILPSFEGTLQKLGVGADGVKTTPLSGEPNVFKGPSPEADALLQAGVDSIYGRFVGIVAQARHKSPAYINGIAQGRVWDGGTARQIGLVDGFGGMQDAIDKAGDLAKLGKDERKVRYLERPVSFRESLVAMLAGDEGQDNGNADAFAMFAGSTRQLSTALWRANQVLSGPTIQAQCLECPLDAARPKIASDLGLLGLIRSWLG